MTPTHVVTLNPLNDPRWDVFVESHPKASIFHTSGWLKSLQSTYGYEPFAVTTSRNEEPLSNAIVACRVRSWITGSRLVSLPFSDHCDPLIQESEQERVLFEAIKREVQHTGSRYVELRPLGDFAERCHADAHIRIDETHCIHRLCLSPSTRELFQQFHKSCVRRTIRKAQSVGLCHEEGRSEELLQQFYTLLLMSRRRKHLPVQPIDWFRNLILNLGQKLRIMVASISDVPIASIITCHHRDTVIYKYGCSDATHHRLGGMSLLIWKAILEAKELGATCFDLGRSDNTNLGLIAFKNRWGGTKRSLPYYRSSDNFPAQSDISWKHAVFDKSRPYLPTSLIELASKRLYRHAG